MIFEIGKYYQHAGGEMMSVVGEAVTTMYGKALIAECSGMFNLKPIGRDETSASGWSEITKGKWLSNFSRDKDLPPVFTEKLMRFGIVQLSGNIYPESVMEIAIHELDQEGRQLFGTIGMPDYNPDKVYLDISERSHEIKNLRIVDNDLLGDIYLLNTPKGKLLWEMMQEIEVEFRLASLVDSEQIRGVGHVSRFQFLGIHAISKVKHEPLPKPL